MKTDVRYIRPMNAPGAYYIEVRATRAEAGEPEAPMGVVPSGRFAGVRARITTGYAPMRAAALDAAAAAGLSVAGLRWGMPSHGPGYITWAARIEGPPRGLGIEGEEA